MINRICDRLQGAYTTNANNRDIRNVELAEIRDTLNTFLDQIVPDVAIQTAAEYMQVVSTHAKKCLEMGKLSSIYYLN